VSLRECYFAVLMFLKDCLINLILVFLAFRHSGIQSFRHSVIQTFRHSNIQAFKQKKHVGISNMLLRVKYFANIFSMFLFRLHFLHYLRYRRNTGRIFLEAIWSMLQNLGSIILLLLNLVRF